MNWKFKGAGTPKKIQEMKWEINPSEMDHPGYVMIAGKRVPTAQGYVFRTKLPLNSLSELGGFFHSAQSINLTWKTCTLISLEKVQKKKKYTTSLTHFLNLRKNEPIIRLASQRHNENPFRRRFSERF